MGAIVSVIVPAYNAEKTIDKCLDSLLNQTLKEIEVIVINDCSTDDTLKKLKSYDDNRLVIINNKSNLGPAASRNKGLDKATGKYIGFVDSDDYVDKSMYKTMVESMKKDVDLVCCSRYNIIGGNKKPIINENKTDNPHEFSKTSNYNVDKLFKKEIIDKYNLRQPENYKYAEDFAFNIRYKYYAHKMVILPDPFYYYIYDSEGSITNTYNKNIVGIIDVLSDTMDFFKKEDKFEEYYDELFNVSKGFYFRRVREFKRFNDKKLKKEFVDKFFDYFKKYFPDYRKGLKEFNGKDKKIFYRYKSLMHLYIKLR